MRVRLQNPLLLLRWDLMTSSYKRKRTRLRKAQDSAKAHEGPVQQRRSGTLLIAAMQAVPHRGFVLTSTRTPMPVREIML